MESSICRARIPRRNKNASVHDLVTMQQIYIETLEGSAAIFSVRLCLTNVSKAYLQSIERLKRDVYASPSAELRLASNKLLIHMKPLFDLVDSGDY